MSTSRVHGKKIRCNEGYWAFLPAHLPPPLEWNDTLVRALSDADRLIGQLGKEGVGLPNPHLMVQPFVRCEAVLSSRIEGTHTSLSELFAEEAGVETSQRRSDVQEVENYVKAMEFGIRRLKEIPLSLRLIREIHAHLMKGVHGDMATPGEFRRSQNWIGVPGSTIATASYVPPPPHQILQCMGDLEKFLHESTLPPLVTIGLVHQQFEAIHPFLDGNGRVGRLLITLYLIEKEILPSPILYLSAFIEKTRSDYYARLKGVTSNGLWEDWIHYFLNGVARQSEETLKRIREFLQIVEKWKALFQKKADAQCLTLIDDMTANPFITIHGTVKKHGIAFTTAQRAIEKLVKAGVLQRITDRQRNRVFCAQGLLKILNRP